ncbi:Holo-[acyl-carrier-protein] synthase [Balamuthia mandrillaris]
MLVGLGTDIVHVPRVEGVLQRWGLRFLRKVLHPHELGLYSQRQGADARLGFVAGRWAAKEAVFKALGQARGSILFPELCISYTSQGAATLTFEGKAALLAKRLSVGGRTSALATKGTTPWPW